MSLPFVLLAVGSVIGLGVKDAQARRQQQSMLEFFLHIIPSNIFAAFSSGDLLPVVFFAVLFGVGWWLGHQQGAADGAPASPIARVLGAVGLGGAHFTLRVDSDPPGAWIAIDGRDDGVFRLLVISERVRKRNRFITVTNFEFR